MSAIESLRKVFAPSLQGGERRSDNGTRALCSVDTAKWLLDISEDGVLELVESGELLWAWDLASIKANRRLVRLLGKSIESYKAGLPQWSVSQDLVIDSILPGQESFTGQEMARCFNVSPSHVIGLINEGSLQLAPGGETKRGANGSPIVPRAAVCEFLKQRRFC